MSLKKMKKEDLELISNKDIAYMILEESKKALNTADIFKKIIKLLELPDSVFEDKIAEFYTTLATDKRFVLLENGKWDLRSNHTSDKVVIIPTDEDEEDDEEENDEEEIQDDKTDDMLDEDNYDDTDESDYDDDTNEELKDLVIIDEDELELEE